MNGFQVGSGVLSLGIEPLGNFVHLMSDDSPFVRTRDLRTCDVRECDVRACVACAGHVTCVHVLRVLGM